MPIPWFWRSGLVMDCGSWGRVISGPTSSCIQCSQMCRAASTGGHLDSSSPPCVHHSIGDLKEASGMCRKLFFVTSSRSYLLGHSPLEVFNLYNIFESHKGAKKGKEKKCWYSGGTLKVVVGDHERTHKSREAINVMCVSLEGGKKERKGRKQAT